jgi:cytochrome P450
MNAVTPLMPELDFGTNDLVNLHELFDELRHHGSIVPIKYLGAPMWMVLNYAEVNQILLDEDNFPAAEGYMELVEPAMGRTSLTLSGDELRHHRAAVISPFLPTKARSYIETLIEPVAQELMDEMEGKPEVEFVDAFTRRFPFRVITRLLCIPVSDEAMLLKWALGIISYPWDPEGALETKRGFDEYMLKVMEQRRHNPGDDFISSMMTALKEGKVGSEEEILSFLRNLFPAGSDTTYKAGGSLFAAVFSDPKLCEMAKGSDADREALVTESLRWQPPTSLLPRKAAKDATVGGVDIKKGDWLILAITGANSDPKLYPNPRQFDPSRRKGEVTTFGKGAHFCIGLHLARRELETALRVVFSRFPDMRLKPGTSVEFFNAGLQRGPRALWVQPMGHD